MADRQRNFCRLSAKRTRNTIYLYSLLVIFIFLVTLSSVIGTNSKCDKTICYEGDCVNGTCVCNKGWTGKSCGHCTGRVVLSTTGNGGFIADGNGNYSEDNKCTWLIDTGTDNATIHLQFHQFATECGWDHLYVYDGDSVFSPLLAAYSGLIRQTLVDDAGLPVVTARSGRVYIYFYSDAAYNMSGFNVSYSIDNCPKGCMGRGTCTETGKCRCNSQWSGTTCETKVCPHECKPNGQCIDGVCVCNASFTGVDCNASLSEGVWKALPAINMTLGRASAASVMIGDNVYVAGGYTFNDKDVFLSRYNLKTNVWKPIQPVSSSSENPMSRYGHTLVAYKDKLLMYGGVVGVNGTKISSSLFKYHITSNAWSIKNKNANATQTVPVAVAGHTAHVLGDTMYIIFGHSPVYGYMNRVQEYFIKNDTWVIPRTSGAIVQGGYGHTSTYDPETNIIYVYGGYHSGSKSNYRLTDKMYGYRPQKREWIILRGNGSPRYLHTAVILDGMIYIFGGNTHNDTSVSHGAKCYSTHMFVYDIACNSWYQIESASLPSNGARYGHSAVIYEDNGTPRMNIIGGFNGIMQNNILQFTPGNCSYYNTNESCLTAQQGVKCVWVYSAGCMSLKDSKDYSNELIERKRCDPAKGRDEFCPSILSCPTCLSTAYGCSWCSNNCTTSCSAAFKSSYINQWEKCEADNVAVCSGLHNCYACNELHECKWDINKGCRPATEEEKTKENEKKCIKPCYVNEDCENCTLNNCMWCANRHRCVETNSYVASFIFGQCMEWMTSQNKCPATYCSDLHTCKECHSNPMCGWCNDPSNTGIGKCMEGGAKGAGHDPSKGDENLCPASRWFFTRCPDCQCNGHSTCNNVTWACDNCKDMTIGAHCETCQDGYYGDPTNGGTCSRCECNGQAVTCNNRTGDCFCLTRGVIGKRCEKCDTVHKYNGNPENGGTCYYDLVTDYQFTFNLSKKDDKHYRQINFRNIPTSEDRDVDFKVNCSGEAYLNITVKTNTKTEQQIVDSYDCSSYFRAKFEHQTYSFGSSENTTFLVFVYGFQTPFWLQISFSQFPKIDLVHFFVTFFSCFLSLLIIAAVLYKIKHKYDNYRRRQRMIVEMEEMASRPFSTVILEIEKRSDSYIAEKKDANMELRKRKKASNKPSQVTLEPLANQKAAVLTLVVQLPSGDEDWTPSGCSGVAIASALVTLGHHRKQSVEHGGKGDKNKFKKHSFPAHNDTCV